MELLLDNGFVAELRGPLRAIEGLHGGEAFLHIHDGSARHKMPRRFDTWELPPAGTHQELRR
jgi:hypothetical protein